MKCTTECHRSQYKAPQTEIVTNIKEVTSDSLHAAFDTIGSADVQTLIVRALAGGAGKVVTILPIAEEARQLRDDVQIICQYPPHRTGLYTPAGLTRLQIATIVYTAIGMEFELRGKVWPASQADRTHMVQFLAKVPELVRTGKVKPNPTKLFEGGLDGINAGLKYLMEGKNSGEKIVYRLA